MGFRSSIRVGRANPESAVISMSAGYPWDGYFSWRGSRSMKAIFATLFSRMLFGGYQGGQLLASMISSASASARYGVMS